MEIIHELEIGNIAHGGHCVARYEGRVVFVRHALPGERVKARLTAAGENAKFWRADAVHILKPSEHRVPHIWDQADALKHDAVVGGAEFGHIHLAFQRQLKRKVILEQLQRLAKIEDFDVVVEIAPGDEEHQGLYWRTRNQFGVNAQGKLTMYQHHGSISLPVTSFPLAQRTLEESNFFAEDFTGMKQVNIVSRGEEGDPIIMVEPLGQRKKVSPVIEEHALGHTFNVAASGFWQIHQRAPEVLVHAVMEAAAVQEGDQVADLYSGSGLFTAFLAQAVGAKGQVTAIESHPVAALHARENLAAYPWVQVRVGQVENRLSAQDSYRTVVLDPPRAGAGKQVMQKIIHTQAQRIVYVACDPAAMARDIGTCREYGYRLSSLRAFDLYPHTHHVECVATLDKNPEPAVSSL